MRRGKMTNQVIKAPEVLKASDDGETHRFDAYAINLSEDKVIVAIPRDISDASFRKGSQIILNGNKFIVSSIPKTFPEYQGYTRVLVTYKANKLKDDRYYKFIVDCDTYDYIEVTKE